MSDIRQITKAKKARRMMKAAMMLAMVVSMTSLMQYPAMATVDASPQEETPMKRNARTVLYVMDQAQLNFRDADASAIDQLNVSFALIENGKADISHWKGTKKVQSFLKKHPHIDGVLAVGGWGADGFSDAVQTDEGRKLLADSLLETMDALGFVGLDIDWEYPGVSGNGITSREEDVENYYALLELLRNGLDVRETLHGRQYILSAAIGAGESALAALDPARLDKYLDQAVVMAYDLVGFDRMTGHHAGLYPGQNRVSSGDWAVQQLVQGGFPAGKVLLGVPAYGRVWRQVAGGGTGLGKRAGTSGNRTISFDEVLRLEDAGYQPYYDDIAQAAWWFDGDTFVSAESSASIQAKGDYIRQNELLGAAVWQYAQDASGAMLSMLEAALRPTQ